MSHTENYTQQNTVWKKTMNILCPFVVYYLVHDLAQILLLSSLSAVCELMGEVYVQAAEANAASVNGVLNALALTAGMAVLLPAAIREMHRQQPDVRHRNRKNRAGGAAVYILLIVCAAALAVGMNLLLTYMGLTQASVRYEQVSRAQHGVGLGLGLILYGVISPLAEEIVFRGLIYNRLRRELQVLPAVVICGVLFGVYHGNVVQGIYGSILGIVITLMYEWYRSLCAPVLFHAAANVSVFAVSSQMQSLQRMMTPAWTVGCMLTALIALVGIAAVFKSMDVKEDNANGA